MKENDIPPLKVRRRSNKSIPANREATGAPMLWLRSPETRKELGIAEAFDPFAAITLGYAASVPPLRPRERPEIVWV